ncbi:hypothetical protein [Demequina globuliformis]|uniref:hypothetical protein n=1 Tax=Demequina globuliformis TaxID=676202 RepID=UPI00078123CA|nr:hypothetical protein [Demequina globuliformis]
MILDLASVTVLFATGACFAVASNARGALQAVLTVVSQAVLLPGVGWLLVVAHLPVNHGTLGFAVCALGVGALGWRLWRHRHESIGIRHHVAWAWLALAYVLTLVVASVARSFLLYKWSTDSLAYLNVTALLNNDTYVDTIYPLFLEERLVGVALLHLPGALSGEWFFHAATPLTFMAVAAMGAWAIWRVLSMRVRPAAALGAAAIFVLALAATNRLVFTGFYVNGHATVALAFIVICAGAWVLAEGLAGRELVPVMILAGAAAVVTRPDSIVALAVLLCAFATQSEIPRQTRALVLAGVGASAVAWQSYVVALWALHGPAMSMPAVVSWFIAVGVVAMAGLALLRWPARFQVWILATGEFGLWAVVALATALTTGLVKVSVLATWDNLIRNEGGWFPMLPLLPLIVGFAVVCLRRATTRPLRFAVTTFFPVMLLLGVARGSAYRVGAGDSLNRAWAHVVPTAVVLAVALIALGTARYVRTSRLVCLTDNAGSRDTHL